MPPGPGLHPGAELRGDREHRFPAGAPHGPADVEPDRIVAEREPEAHGAAEALAVTGRPVRRQAPPAQVGRTDSGEAADSEAPARTTVVYSMAPSFCRRLTTEATVDCFWPMAT